MSHLHVYYDTRYGPVTFDYALFLVCAEAQRQKSGLPFIDLNIIAPDYRQRSPRDLEISRDEKNWRVNHIHMRLPNLLPTVNRVALQKSIPSQILLPTFPSTYPPRTDKDTSVPYIPKYITKYFLQGCDVQPFRASARALEISSKFTGATDYYTISLRTTEFQRIRNSRLDEWYEVYKYLKSNGFNVFVIPDFEDVTATQEAYLYDWTIAEFATHELDLRLALYSQAIDNLCVNNGIAHIMSFAKVPFKMFQMVTPGIDTTSESFIFKNAGVSKDGSPLYFEPNQRWVWKDDKARNILEELAL